MVARPALPASADAITPAWLHQALIAGGMSGLPAIMDVAVTNIGAGVGMMAEVLRCHLSYGEETAAGPGSVIVKLPSSQPKHMRLSRRLSLYKREYQFYRYVAPDAPVRTPQLLYGDFDDSSQRFVLVLEDRSCMGMVDQEIGASPEQAKRVIRAMARLHGHYWDAVNHAPMSGLHDSTHPKNRVMVQLAYLAYLAPTLRNFGGCFSDRTRRLAEAYGPKVAAHMGEVANSPKTFIHGDLRLDNIFFGDGEELALIDWQVSGLGSGLYDVAYFLGASVTSEVRRAIEREALEEYQEIVRGMGARELTFEACWRLYRSNTLARLLISVLVGGGLDISDQRGRKLSELSLQRSLTAIEDLEADQFLPGRRPLFSFANAFSTLSRGAYLVYKTLR